MLDAVEQRCPVLTQPVPLVTPRAVSLKEASRFWFQLGWVSFGGPAGQIALLHRELVDRRRWLSEQRYLHAVNYCMLLPGPEAMQLATYLGWLMHGVPGGLIAGGLFVIPSVFVLTALASVYALWGQLPLLASVFAVLKPAVLAIVLMAAWRIGPMDQQQSIRQLIKMTFCMTTTRTARLMPASRAGVWRSRF